MLDFTEVSVDLSILLTRSRFLSSSQPPSLPEISKEFVRYRGRSIVSKEALWFGKPFWNSMPISAVRFETN